MVQLDVELEAHSFADLDDVADENFELSMSRVALAHTRNEKSTPANEIDVEEMELLLKDSKLPVEIVQQEMSGAPVESSSESSEEEEEDDELALVPPARIDMDDPEVRG